jgi:Fe-S cluster biosynthesis and repair protein YggX
MSRSVQCVLLKREAPGLERPPYPGPLGQRIFENVSKEGWERWRGHQIMLINEYRLTPVDPKARNSSKPRWRSSSSGLARPSRASLSNLAAAESNPASMHSEG